MKINELKAFAKDVELEAKITEVSEPKEVTTKFGTQIMLTVATLEDDSGSIKLSLWGDQSNGVEVGKTLILKGGFVRQFKSELQLSMMKTGSITVE